MLKDNFLDSSTETRSLVQFYSALHFIFISPYLKIGKILEKVMTYKIHQNNQS